MRFRVWGVGPWVLGLGFWAKGLEFGIKGSGFKALGLDLGKLMWFRGRSHELEFWI